MTALWVCRFGPPENKCCIFCEICYNTVTHDVTKF